MARAFLTAQWRHLVLLNYVVDPQLLEPFVPAGTKLDHWQERTYISVVGFLFRNTRVHGLGLPWHRHFEEVNLRFYVRRETPEGPRRGVVFIKELVPRWAIARIARVLYNENYVAVPMGHELTNSDSSPPWIHRVRYTWQFGGGENAIDFTASGPPVDIPAGSEIEFITEHYYGYTRQRDGGTLEYRVDHPRWLATHAASATLTCNVAELYGPRFVAPLESPPHSACLAEGSDVTVYRGVKIT